MIKPEDDVIVKVPQQVGQQEVDNWWIGQVIFCEGGARDPKVNTMFQVANVDDGCITWVNDDAVMQRRCGRVMRTLGFEASSRKVNGRSTRVLVRTDVATPIGNSLTDF